MPRSSLGPRGTDPPAGALIAASDRLATENWSRTEYNLTIVGLPFAWTTTIDGWVKRRSGDPGTPYRRGDVGVGKAGDEHPADGEIQLADAVYVLGYLFLGAAEPPSPFGAAGLDATLDALGCVRYP